MTDSFKVIKLRELSLGQLKKISRDLALGLSVQEMARIQSYFKNLGRDPTDVELQAIGQAWSEHCGYKSSKIYLKKYIFGLNSEKIYSQGDAGVVLLDDEYAVALKMESHNHPSAIEPYGGASTGVGGILRDILSMGAQPVAVTDVLYFGIRKYKNYPSPEFIKSGVISGIRDYGNRVGIPTVSGGIYYSDMFSPNVLVNVGCVGILKKDKIAKQSIDKKGIKLIIAGGKTGRDGIHGVNMASANLDSGSANLSTVQLGNPIIKEPLIHAVLEANESGLIYSLKDLGGGGLSSVVGEMLYAGGMGGVVYLDKVPLKENDMLPWEIWISESQERMLLGVEEKNVPQVLEIMNDWDVTSAVIGESVEGSKLTLYYKGEVVMDLDLDFVTSPPLYQRANRITYKEYKFDIPKERENYDGILLKMLSDPNIASKEYAVRQYDHTVRGNTVIPPFTGIIGKEGPSDASVIKINWENYTAISIAHGSNPFYSQIDPYMGARNAVDEAYRNLVSANSIPIAFSDCLNSGNPERPERMGEFISMIKGLSDEARELGVPFVSGNVSLYNETGLKSIPSIPTILAVGKLKDYRKAITPDFKGVGNPIYLIGKPEIEFGGSLYFRIQRKNGGRVPYSNPKVLYDRSERVLKAMDLGLVLSSHDVSEGGFALAIAEMTIGSDIGAEIDLTGLTFGRPDFFMFSESQSMFIVEIQKGKENEFEREMGGSSIKLGYTGGQILNIKLNGRTLINLYNDQIRSKWKEGYT